MPRPAPPRPQPRDPVGLGRRRFLGSAVVGLIALGASGCDAGDAPAPQGAVTPTAPPVDADTDLVQETGQRIADTAALVSAAGAAAPALRARARRLDALHRTHLEVLEWEGTAHSPDPVRRQQAAATLRRAEQRLQRHLVDASLAAGSGGLAQLFAAMAAGVAQHEGAVPVSTAAVTTGRAGGAGSAGALQDALAAEHAAIFVYGALGARTSASASPASYGLLTEAYRTHQARRDALLEMVRAAGATPRPAEPGYQLGALQSSTQIERRARQLESASQATYTYLVANTTGDQRRFAITALLDSAVRARAFGAPATSLPGIADT